MIRAILLDCGGVIVAPASGDWMLPPDHEDILGKNFADARLPDFRKARGAFLSLLPDACKIATDAEEYAMFPEYFAQSLGAMGMPLTREQAERLAYLQTYRDDRYILFDDVLEWLGRWRGQYKLGIVSDAPPSTARIMETMGVASLMDGMTFSCDLGILKPNAEIYRNTLRLLGVEPEDAVFVDDIEGNLLGAEAIGIRGIQMIRPMPARFVMPARWTGPVVHNFAELDTLLKTM